MKSAKYYIYRNLHTGGFSVKRRGKVIDRPHQFMAINALFVVNENGRQRVIGSGHKNVHAYLVCDDYVNLCQTATYLLSEITYNPYLHETFIKKGAETPVYNSRYVYGYQGIIAAKDYDINI